MEIGLIRGEWTQNGQSGDGGGANNSGDSFMGYFGWGVDVGGEVKGRNQDDLSQDYFLPKSDCFTKHLALLSILGVVSEAALF